MCEGQNQKEWCAKKRQRNVFSFLCKKFRWGQVNIFIFVCHGVLFLWRILCNSFVLNGFRADEVN